MSGESLTEHATLGGGCFWCVEAVYQRLQGVKSVVSGYAGGHAAQPSYEAVCTGRTGHAEVVQIEFDPQALSYADLLDVFFHTHDPTTLNRQGNDVGTQYRSVIFYHHDEQKRIATQAIERLNASGAFSGPIVTQVAPFEAFYPAEDDHQNYFNEHPSQSYCALVIDPKVKKFQKQFSEKLKSADA